MWTLTSRAKKGSLCSTIYVYNAMNFVVDIKSTAIPVFTIWKRHRLPGYECGLAAIGPRPGHPRQPDPHHEIIGNGPELIVFALVSHPGQVGMVPPAVGLGVRPVKEAFNQSEPR